MYVHRRGNNKEINLSVQSDQVLHCWLLKFNFSSRFSYFIVLLESMIEALIL